MQISIKITRKENAEHYDSDVGDVISIPLKDYISGVVASEIGNAPVEACKAQAIAARTYAWKCIKNNKPISDSSSTAQAFRSSRIDPCLFPNAVQASEQTDNMLLYYNGTVIDTCVYSASNGGKTVSSKDRWGGERPWLIEQDDPWDYAKSCGKRKGHGVGMSQIGAIYAAEQGKNYEEIQSFYYPMCDIKSVEQETNQSASSISDEKPQVKASYLISGFNQMLKEHWKYEWGKAEYGCVDCSGAFVYWYKKANSYMYHGSNTMYRKYSVRRGKIGDIKLIPGMAVYKRRDWKSDDRDNKYYGDDTGNMYHVGLYIGADQVIEAKGTQYGVVQSKLSEWTHTSDQRDTLYDVEPPDPIDNVYGVVVTESGSLNLRSGPSTDYGRVAKIPQGATIQILKTDVGVDGWYYISYDGKVGYVMSKFVKITDTPDPEKEQYALIMHVGEKEKAEEFQRVLNEMGLDIMVISEEQIKEEVD